ncbi:Uncharacterised protein [Veillonella criceti]|uniref:Uncharacterized protein n=1 Tax=Veillonella criceti TaxID=103891 RepID=A0A380NMA9_9FIRM|nr:Uncharacterised protein [Veillonella criceti]
MDYNQHLYYLSDVYDMLLNMFLHDVFMNIYLTACGILCQKNDNFKTSYRQNK